MLRLLYVLSCLLVCVRLFFFFKKKSFRLSSWSVVVSSMFHDVTDCMRLSQVVQLLRLSRFLKLFDIMLGCFEQFWIV